MPNAQNKMPIRTHKRQEGMEAGRVEGGTQLKMRQNTFSKCKRRNVASLRCVVVAIKCLASSLPTPAPSGARVEVVAAGAAAATQWQPQIMPKYGATQRNATHRIDCRFISIRCVSIYLSPVVGNWNCISQRLLSSSSTSSSFASATSRCVSLCSAFCCCLSASLSLFLCLFSHSTLLSLGPSPQVIIVNN